MELKRLKSAKRDLRTKNSVFGFIGEYERRENKNIPMMIKHMIWNYVFIDLCERITVKKWNKLICLCGKELKKGVVFNRGREIAVYDCDICGKEIRKPKTNKNKEYLWHCSSNSKLSRSFHGESWDSKKRKNVTIGFDVCGECRIGILKREE